jgi:hypothetical protein
MRSLENGTENGTENDRLRYTITVNFFNFLSLAYLQIPVIPFLFLGKCSFLSLGQCILKRSKNLFL